MPFLPEPHLPIAGHPTLNRLALRGITLLLVEDSRFACDALRLILTRAGARLRRAGSLETAKLHLGCYLPDLALVDLGLPDGRGEDLIAELAGRGLPVLGLSGDPDGRHPALAAGARAFVEKPIPSVAGLVGLIRQLAGGRNLAGDEEDQPVPPGDPAALRDDLTMAVDLVQTKGNPAYALAFVQGLARAAGDQALATAAGAAHTGFDRARLARMIKDRLAALPPAV